jgi:transcriptional regulator of acetoin/glycerol metabolism
MVKSDTYSTFSLDSDLTPRLRVVEYDWPGNIRELRGVARRLAAVERGGGEEALRVIVDEAVGSDDAAAMLAENLAEC